VGWLLSELTVRHLQAFASVPPPNPLTTSLCPLTNSQSLTTTRVREAWYALEAATNTF